MKKLTIIAPDELVNAFQELVWAIIKTHNEYTIGDIMTTTEPIGEAQ
jgi:hypothetical protein